MDGSSSRRVWEEVLPKIIHELKVDFEKKKPIKYFIRCTSSDSIWSSKVVDDLNSKQWTGRLYSLRKTNPGCFIFYSEQQLEEGQHQINGNTYKLNLFKLFRKKSKKPQEENSEKIAEKKLIAKAFVFGIPQTRETFDSVVNKIGQVEEVIYPDINKTHTPRAIVSFSNIYFSQILDEERLLFTHTENFPPMSIVWFNFVKDNKNRFKEFYSELNKSEEQKLNELAEKCLAKVIQKNQNQIKKSSQQSVTTKNAEEEKKNETMEEGNNSTVEDKSPNMMNFLTQLEESSDSEQESDTNLDDAIDSLNQINLYPMDLNVGEKRTRILLDSSPNSPPNKMIPVIDTPPITPTNSNSTVKKKVEENKDADNKKTTPKISTSTTRKDEVQRKNTPEAEKKKSLNVAVHKHSTKSSITVTKNAKNPKTNNKSTNQLSPTKKPPAKLGGKSK